MIKIEKGRYTLSEIKKRLDITDYQFKYRKGDVLDWMKSFFDFEIVTEGRDHHYVFVIKEVFADYEPFPRKTKRKQIEKFYKEKTDEIIHKYPRNTGSNIGRMIIAEDNKYNHQEETAATYVRPVLRNDYSKGSSVWCEFDAENNIYMEITDEQQEYLSNIFKEMNKSKEFIEEQQDILSDYKEKVITAKEALKKIDVSVSAIITEALTKFKNKFGFRPIRVPYYGIKI